MKLLPLDRPELLELAASWLARKENYQWLDFGNGRQILTLELFGLMAKSQTHVLRLYTSDKEDTPIGIVGLNNVERIFKTATLWGVAGERQYSYWEYANLAGAKMLTLAFRDLGLHSVNTWIVENNPSLRTIERLRFRFVGRQRQCHFIDGRPYDRLLFDLLAGEHKDLEMRPRDQIKESDPRAAFQDREHSSLGVRSLAPSARSRDL